MRNASQEFAGYLSQFKFNAMSIPVISNVTAKPYKQDDIIDNLTSQIISSVQWIDMVVYLMGLGEMEFKEISTVKVLTSLITRIKKEAAL